MAASPNASLKLSSQGLMLEVKASGLGLGAQFLCLGLAVKVLGLQAEAYGGTLRDHLG